MSGERARKVIGWRTLAVVAGAVLIALAAFGAVQSFGSGSRALRSWSWKTTAPGQSVAADVLSTFSSRLGNVDVGTLREVARTETGRGAYRLLAAIRPTGEACFALEAPLFSESFHCLPGLTNNGRHAIVTFSTAGGAPSGAVEHANVFGIARQDVARIVLERQNGSSAELPLNAWRAFAYDAESATALPATVRAYAADGRLLDASDVTPTSPGPQ
jgi:hypothetical protein